MHASAKTRSQRSAIARQHHVLLRTPWLLTILMASGLCLAYLIGVFANWGQAADRSLYANLGMIPIGLAATILAASASRTQAERRSQWAWRLLAAGLACFLAGDVLFFVYQNVLSVTPFPSPADAGYLAYYPLAFAGLLWFPKVGADRPRRSALYLGSIIALTAGAVAILYFFLLPTVQSSREDILAYSLSVGYPVGDLLLLFGIAWMLMRRGPSGRLSIMLLSAGLVVGLGADLAYGYQNLQGTFQSGGYSDAGYMLSWALFAWAGYMAAMRDPHKNTQESSRGRLSATTANGGANGVDED